MIIMDGDKKAFNQTSLQMKVVLLWMKKEWYILEYPNRRRRTTTILFLFSSHHQFLYVHVPKTSFLYHNTFFPFILWTNRFHLLSEFDNGKRSCRKRLADHNRRRRKSQQQQQQANQEPSCNNNKSSSQNDTLTSSPHNLTSTFLLLLLLFLASHLSIN